MKQVHTVGLDTTKLSFQVHGATASGEVVVQKKLRRHQLDFGGLGGCQAA